MGMGMGLTVSGQEMERGKGGPRECDTRAQRYDVHCGGVSEWCSSLIALALHKTKAHTARAQTVTPRHMGGFAVGTRSTYT